ncbi:phosphotransferase [Glycomyces sp. NPDC046736]|uniref:phosphotransferase n=1 Tax=Glycomyces sp. NPDC046736 TaxID=3155615 RepID=UPI0033EBD9D2
MTSSPTAGTDAIARAYGLGEIRAVRYLANGILNRNWRLETERGVFALKELDELSPEAARQSLRLMPKLAAAGVPVVSAVPSLSGAVVVEIDGGAYYLAPWVEGGHPRGDEMDPGRSFHMGAVIGRIHRALADPVMGLRTPARPEYPVADPGKARARIQEYLALIEARPEPDEFDRAVVPLLHERLELLAAHTVSRPEFATYEPYGWIHGDCQNWNLLWQGDRIAAVLDWDRLRVNAYGEEIARAAMYQCVLPSGRVDLDNVRALIAGYRTESAIGADALVEAARHRWWRMASSVWHLKYHYDKGTGSADEILFSDERLLRWWTANLDEVEAAFAG